jgi:glutaredoxin
MAAIKITVYRWGGEWGPFRVKIPCGECTLTQDIIQSTLDNELKPYDVEVETLDWLSHWWEPLLKGGWHAPIVMVNGEIVSQGEALNRGVLTQAVIAAGVKQKPVQGNLVYGKPGCPYCVRAKALFDTANLPYEYQDVVASPNALYEMLGRVKPLVGPKTPITMPQIWLDGGYIGGATELEAALTQSGKLLEENGLRIAS